jgi:hypothetical protein
MTDYFVRKSGSDGAAGTSAALAWATVGKALGSSGIGSGDRVFIGAGVYRELVTVNGTYTANTQVIGDVDGALTGDPGEVRLTGFTTNDTTGGGANPTLRVNGKNFLSFSRLHIVGSNAATGPAVQGGTAAAGNAGHDVSFTNCAFTNGSNQVTLPVHVQLAADTASNWSFTNCWFYAGGNNGQLTLQLNLSATADYDSNTQITNCVFVTTGNGNGGVQVTSTGAGTFKGGGVLIRHCHFFDSGLATVTANVSPVYPVLVTDCVFEVLGTTAISAVTLVGNLVEDGNLFLVSSPLTGSITGGRFSYIVAGSTIAYARLFCIGQDSVWGGQSRPFGTPLQGSPILGWGGYLVAAGRNAGTIVDDATVGTISWTNPSNASVHDSTYAVATAIPASTGISHYLKATGFGFSIPSTATILGVRVEIAGLASAVTSISVNSVKLVKAGTISGNDHAVDNTTVWGTANTMQTTPWGTAVDPLWGLTVTPSDVNDTGFGVAVV